jgi:hypothetical protein
MWSRVIKTVAGEIDGMIIDRWRRNQGMGKVGNNESLVS